MSDILWIESDPPVPMAIVLRPFGGVGLRDELRHVKQDGVDTLVSLLERDEAAMLGLAQEGRLAAKAGLTFLSYPIRDTQVPSEAASFRRFALDLADRVRFGEHVGIHCRGSVGRTTIMAACTLIHLGWTAKKALAAIEKARGCPVPDTPNQREWIFGYEDWL